MHRSNLEAVMIDRDLTSSVPAYSVMITIDQLRFRYPKFETRPLRVRGVDFPIPDDPEAVLEAKYGPTWRVPDRAWDNMLSPRNLEMGHLRPAVRSDIEARRAQLAVAKGRSARHAPPGVPSTKTTNAPF